MTVFYWDSGVSSMDVEKIIKTHLRKKGATGLCNEECSCAIHEIGFCTDVFLMSCKPAKYVMCSKCIKPDACHHRRGGKDCKGYYKPMEILV